MNDINQDGLSKIDRFYEKHRDVAVTVSYGMLSAILGLIKINTPGFEGSYSDLREVALIVCLFHLRKPIYIIPLCLITLIGIPFNTRLIAVFLMHVIPLGVLWYVYDWLRQKNLRSLNFSFLWNLLVFGYFTLLLYPILIITYQLLGFNTEVNFINSYKSIFESGLIEMITTCFITALYLLQLSMRRKLKNTNIYLEEMVQKRTSELSEANEELLNLNENLEHLVQERTTKISSQLAKITEYAHINSHEVRGPLARIMGLIKLINATKEIHEIIPLINKLEQSANELDEIVRKMNGLLGSETQIND
ncbi:hypothetical protein GCM10027429_29360 [Marivirga atlantica]|jgi:signal transduction histidine kinase|uniref:Signal transduction histidine kinase dimerisation/phosphoacceptor domain-containing protein n=1 Tax=Marivirga atlantica TaxID=1548457 RepID=A0A937ACX7_9BACT|nr:hypothetical protein [Marivirga atlantica]MBL0766515.1 hypothetical protein [Marivirga atlantica]